MKALTITAQPKPEAGWVHRFRNFGEDVYARLRASCEVSIAEIDAAFDEFHVVRIREKEVAEVTSVVAALNREHHLDDSVFVAVGDAPVFHQTAVIVLDAGIGDRLWEIAGRHPMWVVGSEVNKVAVDWLGVLANNPSINKLTIYGAAATTAAVAALQEHGFAVVLPTASGFIALKEPL